jgi:hypothetical protein
MLTLMRLFLQTCLAQIPGQAQTFLDHIKLGIEAAAADPAALLLFSGGQTRQAAGPRSEGLSYWMVAEAAGWYGHPEVRSRAFTEVGVTFGRLLKSSQQLLVCRLGTSLQHIRSSRFGCTVDMAELIQRYALGAVVSCLCKGLQDTQIEKTMQQNAALTLLDGAPATMADHC